MSMMALMIVVFVMSVMSIIALTTAIHIHAGLEEWDFRPNSFESKRFPENYLANVGFEPIFLDSDLDTNPHHFDGFDSATIFHKWIRIRLTLDYLNFFMTTGNS
jgi:hypothetical protein